MKDEGSRILGGSLDIDPSRFYTVSEVAPLLRVTERTVRKYCGEGVFPNAVRVAGGRRWLIPGLDMLELCPHLKSIS